MNQFRDKADSVVGVSSVGDLESLEDLEMVHDLKAYRQAKADDDGKRVSLENLRRELRS